MHFHLNFLFSYDVNYQPSCYPVSCDFADKTKETKQEQKESGNKTREGIGPKRDGKQVRLGAKKGEKEGQRRQENQRG